MRSDWIPHVARAAFVLLGHSAAVGQTTFQGLGILPGFDGSCAASVSRDGRVVVGGFDEPEYPASGGFRWTPEGSIEPVPYLFPGGLAYASAVTPDGTTVVGNAGEYVDGNWIGRAFRLDADGLHDLGLPPGHPDWLAAAMGISDDRSTIVGVLAVPAIFGTFDYHAFRWTEAGGMSVLEDFGGQLAGWARSVSGDGSRTVGYTAFGACVWNPAGKATTLQPLPGGGWCDAYAVSSDGGTVVGYSTDEINSTIAVRWRAGGAEPLGDIPNGEGFNLAYGVSGDGSIIVGRAWDLSGAQRAFVWDQAEGMRDLNEVLTSRGVDLGGWVLRAAWATSSDGRVIVGWGDNPDGKTEAWIATLAGACYPDFIDDDTLDLFDFLAYVNAFNGDDLRSDCDLSGGLDLFDFLCFTNGFNAGC